MSERYRLTTDDDGHWYLVPVSQREAFDDWVYAVGAGDMPPGVQPVPGWAGLVTFTDPQIEV